MKNRLRIFLGVAIMILGCSIPTIEKAVVSVVKTAQPSIRKVMDIERPTDVLIESSMSIDAIITDKKDKESFAIFNKEFSDRVSSYQAKGQSVLQIYSAVSEEVFGLKLKGKYGGEVGVLVVDTMKSVLGDFNTPLTDQKKAELKDRFNAIAWSLGGEGYE